MLTLECKQSDLVCFILYRVFGYRKSVVRSNIKRAFPSYTDSELMFIERKFYSHLCDLFLEIIKSMGMSKDEMIKNIDKLKKDLFNFRFQKMNSQVTNPAKIGGVGENTCLYTKLFLADGFKYGLLFCPILLILKLYPSGK